MPEPTLLYGIGAPKAGTSWLHDYLANHPDCHFRTLKELHYFDVLEDNGGKWSQWRSQALMNKLRAYLARAKRVNDDEQQVLQQKILDLKEWLAIFDGNTANNTSYLDFLSGGRPSGAKLIGDITPSYAMLNRGSFENMYGLTKQTRFLFLLRDPLDRLWSNIRMNAQRAAEQSGTFGNHLRRQADQYLDDKNHSLAARSDYAGTCTRLTQAVPKNHIHFEFFERMFSEQAITSLAGFLGIAAMPGRVDSKLHGGRAAEMDAGLENALLKKLQPQYEFVQKFFDGNMPQNWQDRLYQSQLVKV